MLVLVSFGLVLLATILLVVGLLSDDGLTLIYFSIASSFTAAVVLYLAFRRARPRGEPEAAAPAPLADDIAPAPAAQPAPAPAAPQPTATEQAATEQAATETLPRVEEPEPTPSAVATTTATEPVEDDWVDDEHWSDEEDWTAAGDFEVEFPIADYDELNVSEIMPLLPQLYSDELEIVAERERSTKNRAAILDRLAELAESGTEADRLEQEAAAAGEQPETVTAAGSPPPTPAPSVSDAPEISMHDEDDDLEYVFPIADYDELTVAQIMPLLPQLELDELEEVKEREVAGQARKSLITEIDRYLSGELELTPWDEETDELAAPARAADQLPIAGYDALNVSDIRPLLSDLSEDELESVREHEAARDNRKTILDDIDRRLGSLRRPTRKAASKKAATRKRAPEKAARKAASKKRTSKKAGAKKAGKKAGKKRAGSKKRAAKKAAANRRFPIANYDDLTVAEIRPRLTDLSDRQLEQVRERERAGAGRKTILDDIDNRLS